MRVKAEQCQNISSENQSKQGTDNTTVYPRHDKTMGSTCQVDNGNC